MYPSYVFAHWWEAITHTCTNCGQRNSVWHGEVEVVE
jgi:hypothetical protein